MRGTTRVWVCGLGLGLWLLLGCSTPVDPVHLRRAEASRQLASVKLSKGQVERAIVEYEQSLKLNERDPETHFGLSEAYRRKGYYDLAEEHLLRTLELDPLNLEARLNLGVVYMQQGRWEDAIRENDRLVKDPGFLRSERALVNRGWAHYKSGALEKAEEDFRAALATEPKNYFAHLNLGIVLYDAGRSAAAAEEFEEVLTILKTRPAAVVAPLLAQARYRLAQAHVKLGQRTQAVEQLRLAATEGGQGEWARRSREYLDLLQ
ncbi:MAG: tetratricopeptide repeat protein [Myxococcota bacterium]